MHKYKIHSVIHFHLQQGENVASNAHISPQILKTSAFLSVYNTT